MITDEQAKIIISDGNRMMMACLDYFIEKNKEINEYVMVPIIILMKIFRLHESIKTLVESNFQSEACVLAIAQFEAKFDLLQAVRDAVWCKNWLEHRQQERSITKDIRKAIKSGFPNDREIAGIEINIFRILSMIKHGNPAASELGFPVRRNGSTITVTSEPVADEFALKLGTMISSYSACQLTWAYQAFMKGLEEYVICDAELCTAVDANFQAFGSFGTEFMEWAESLVLDRSGHLGIARDLGRRPK